MGGGGCGDGMDCGCPLLCYFVLILVICRVEYSEIGQKLRFLAVVKLIKVIRTLLPLGMSMVEERQRTLVCSSYPGVKGWSFSDSK